MKQKILILGSNGMLGQDLVKIFRQDEKYTVIGWDRDDIDVTETNQLRERIMAENPNIIIYSVGYNAVDNAEKDEQEFEMAKKLNAQVPQNLAQIAKDLNAVFVHYVSDYIWDGQKGEYTENDPGQNPLSKYGLSKLLGEENVKAVGCQYFLIRTSKLFGQSAISANAKKSFFEVMLNLAQTNSTLRVVDSEKSCFTYTPDLAAATKLLIEGNYAPGVYHLVNEGAATWYQGLVKLFEIMNIQGVEIVAIQPEDYPRPAKRAASSILVNTKFPKLRPYDQALQAWIKDADIKFTKSTF